MTSSRISRRTLPTHLSAIPFCHGAWMLVRLGFRPVAFRNAMTSASNSESRSRRRLSPRGDSGETRATAYQRRHGAEPAADTGLRSFPRRPSRASEVSVDLGGSPTRVLCRQPPDQRPDLRGDLRPAAARPGTRPYSRNPVRCQPTTVSGLTMTRTSAQRDQMRRRVVHNSRSREFKGGRGLFRLSTATCCRSARTSSAVSPRPRKKTRRAARMERANGSTNSPL